MVENTTFYKKFLQMVLTMSDKNNPPKTPVENQAAEEPEVTEISTDDVNSAPVEPSEAIVPEKSELEMLKEELAQVKDRYLRLAADFENYKKISQREQLNSIKFANENIITSLLPVVDNLEQAIKACKAAGDTKNDVLIGVEMVLKQFVDLLGKFGVEIFSAKGQKFDPARHEAMSEQEDATVLPGIIIEEYQKGYLYNGRLLRPARVVVAKRSSNE